MYLTHTDYLNLGGELNLAAFTRYEFKARQQVNNVSFNRFNDVALPEADNKKLEMCMFELIEFYSMSDALDKNNQITSASNDGVSITYKRYDVDSIRKEVSRIINTYLSDIVINGVRALYVGLYG